ncbi:protein sprint isoform X2 [Bradysia coprophila]|uniref:protein sprint isoform X2 n=1 Tax=Bradysia coprophila TaxID=38358 RepID=UPI00187D7B4D|nr:protein sprint isoform X2 [Bradysia coprophila]
MYPEMESPASPQDQPMDEPTDSTLLLPTPTSIGLQKATVTPKGIFDKNCSLDKSTSGLDTLKNNMDLKDEVSKKRTSLKIENSSPILDNNATAIVDDNNVIIGTVNAITGMGGSKRDSINLDNAVKSDNNNDIYSDCENMRSTDTSDVDNNKVGRNVNTRNEDDGEEDDDDDEEGDYNDMDNENSSDSTHKRDSMTSKESSDDYFLCEKFKNSLNENLRNSIFDNSNLPVELLSPHEGPLGRRYAEIAHFKANNNRSESQHLRTRRLPLCSVDSEDGNGLGDDDMQALLPSNRDLSREDLSQSHASLVSSSDGGVLAEGETSSETSADSTSPPCDLSLVERLLRTHPVWFLPGIQRSGAVHLLQGKEEGNFVVRGSSQTNTMAVSVRLPPDTGPYIEHYLIQSNDSLLSLESSRFKFDSIPALIAHYAQCCDELPVQLTLPRALREAQNRQQLSSLALLGQEFWRYPMATPKPTATTTTSSANTSPIQSNSKTESSGIGTTVFSTINPPKSVAVTPNNNHPVGNVFSPTIPSNVFSQAGTPSDTASSLSSFTSTGQQILSPESVDSVMLTMSPIEPTRSGIIGKTSTFKAINRRSMDIEKLTSFVHTTQLSGSDSNDNLVRTTRPTPPSTLNLAPFRTPPAPPPRWSKPTTPNSPTALTPLEGQLSNNFTVTTTVTFSVDGSQNSQIVEVTSPNSNTTFQTISKRLSPEGECKAQVDTLSSQGSKRWQSQSSKDSSQNNRKVLSPNSAETPTGRSRRHRARKESKHYQESDILESPQVYCRSALGDKISDYEDLWTPDSSSHFGRGPHMSSFRPDGINGKRPDLLPETPGSLGSTNSSPPTTTKPTVSSKPLTDGSLTPFQQSHNFFANNIIHEIKSKEQSNDGQKSPNQHDSKIEHQQLRQSPNSMQQSRNHLGLQLPTSETSSPGSETPVQTPINSRNKQGSPFYAEPADALGNVIRRSQRNVLLPASHRHSEPSKGPMRTAFCQVLSPIESEKSPISGSLDELKKQNRIARGRLDPWPLDSSWEFMGNEDNDYDTDANWKTGNHQKTDKPPKTTEIKDFVGRSLTVHQIIARKLPELNLPELTKTSSTPLNASPELGNGGAVGMMGKNNRISSYDNVERGHSGYATSSILFPDSTHSDDGTVFSEPWDSSQWDSFLPHDDTSDSIHLSKCRPALCNSEDDTIMEEATFTTNNHKEQQNHQQQPAKVATILRTRSCRDREVLCHPRNKQNNSGPGESVAAYALTLAADTSSTFSRNIENFIACTKESREVAPQVVMRNMRQFMSGMKNYLVKHGEGNFQQEVFRARSLLKADEFLNLDTILEGVMHQLVVLPLREYLYGLFVDFYTGTSDIQLLVENVKYASARSAADFGIRSTVTPPSSAAMQQISLLILRLQEAELPLEKLEYLLAVVSAIFEASKHPRGQPLGADDFLPILVFIVAKCGFIGAEIEAEFMWCLLQQSLLNGEAGYYLTALCSAVHVLKTFMASEMDGTGSLDIRSSSQPACSSVLRVIIPDEYNGSLQTRTLPVRPHTTTREVCRTIAHKARITNPQDYGLFKLVDGEETLLMDNDCPQEARLAARGKHCMLAYKRIDAKIAWPTMTSN